MADTAADLAHDAGLAAIFLPHGEPLRAGMRLHQPEYAHTRRRIAADGAAALYAGPLGDALVAAMAATGGIIAHVDLGT